MAMNWVRLTTSAQTPGAVYPLNDVDLATRLSFFLWSSIPDDELLACAERGELGQPEQSAVPLNTPYAYTTQRGRSTRFVVGNMSCRFDEQLVATHAVRPDPHLIGLRSTACKHGRLFAQHRGDERFKMIHRGVFAGHVIAAHRIGNSRAHSR